MLTKSFFDRDPQLVAKELLGSILHFQQFKAVIIETEAYYLHDKASHASLGFTEKRKALFMGPGTLYMYYARGGDSLNVSCSGKGNAVLIKSAWPIKNIKGMKKNFEKDRKRERLCNGQTLLCKAMGIKVKDWDQKTFIKDIFYLTQGNKPQQIIQCKRLGIPIGRDEHLSLRFISFEYAKFCTKNILTKRNSVLGRDYVIL